jgi:pyruvate formate lyase activating enzyme
MQIHGFIKSTLLDYPRHLAATIFLGGCNLRCPFCHNASLVLQPGSQPVFPEEEVLSYLNKRINILEGVCITGGEPTLYPDLPDFIQKIKALGFKVKLDTNGTAPEMLKNLADKKLLDYVAMDIKNSTEHYGTTVGMTDFDPAPVKESAVFLLSGTLDYEFRTTIVRELHTKEDMHSIGKWLTGAKAYYLQSYKDSGDILSPGLSAPDKEALLEYERILSTYLNNVCLRGID